MKEIDVIIDVRTPLDSPDIVLVRQKFAVVDGEFQSIGVPTESKLSLTTPCIQTSVRWCEDLEIGKALVVAIQNSGFTAVVDITVTFHCEAFPAHLRNPYTTRFTAFSSRWWRRLMFVRGSTLRRLDGKTYCHSQSVAADASFRANVCG